MADTTQSPTTWPDLAIGLYDKLTGRGAEISYTFEGFAVHVPDKATESATHTPWKLDGTVKISTRDMG